MKYSILKLIISCVSRILPLLLFSACTSNSFHEFQINGNEEYLQTPLPRKIHSPTGIILPLQNDNYKIPTIVHKGAVGKKLDIRPPN